MNTNYTVMVYCGDVLGLGHMRRNSVITARLIETLPGSNAVLLTSLGPGPLEMPQGVDVVKLPSLTKNGQGGITARTLTIEDRRFLSLRTSLIDSVASSLRPDLVLVDHFPGGVGNELLPTLRRLRESPDAPATVLGLRDILDDPAVIRKRWEDQGAYEAVRELYDAVLVYGSRELFDVGANYGLQDDSPELTYCGYVRAGDPALYPSPSRRDLGLEKGKLVVMTAGGGLDGHPMLAQCIDALRQLGDRPDLEVVCITGPFMSRERVNELRARAAGLPVRLLWCVEQTPSYFKHADLVVTMAGYNTLTEAIGLGKRVLVLPRTGPSAEQQMRCEIFSRRGLIDYVAAEELREPEPLSQRILASLDAGSPTGILPDMDGLDKVVARLRALLGQRDERQGVASPLNRVKRSAKR